MHLKHVVDVRVEPGLRVHLLVDGGKNVVFMLSAMMVEDPSNAAFTLALHHAAIAPIFRRRRYSKRSAEKKVMVSSVSIP
ncbi:hypothetical protein GALL_481880 [mine drainage metagenome]|uniref:Uncharacterized protein n=1 Tax=mine drainage metagenome TaxID=410659 RepID=A0A1J5PG75_9ZZZZ